MPYLVAVSGASGSGKSTFSERLLGQYRENLTVISYDNYYKAQDHLAMEDRILTNYDCPDALDTDLLIRHLEALRVGKTVSMPQYDFRVHTRKKETLLVEPTAVIVVDGILTFHDVRLRGLFDLKIYVDADADERILRRLRRDVTERGRDIDGVITQYVSTVKPMHEIYVEPTKKYADIIVNGGMNEVALDVVSAHIAKALLQQ